MDDETFRRGTPITLSKLGLSRHPYYADRRGTIVGPTRYPSSWRVIWEPARTPVAMHKDYLRIADENS
jgi:hypothetical protein